MAFSVFNPVDRDDKPREACGVFGVGGHPDSAALTALGLHALQHRGQESAGIAAFDGQHFHAERRDGLVGDHFSSESVISRLAGHYAIGHVRYSTFGGSGVRNIQPLYADMPGGGLACAHNGHFTNGLILRRQLVSSGCIFQSTCDTEIILHLAARADALDIPARVVNALMQMEGAYALVLLAKNTLIGARDRLGIRPLVLGTLDGAAVLASETCALDVIGATYCRDIAPGEIFILRDGKEKSLHPFPNAYERPCIFEYIYFSRPDSISHGESFYDYRRRMGAQLAREAPAEADLVVAVPDSGIPAAVGYASALNLPFEHAITRNHYIGRTFIEPAQEIRQLGVKLKHNPNRSLLAGKRVVLVDDSIVRGTTARKIIQMLFEAGAKEIHMRIACPPIRFPDRYGIDTPSPAELIANQHDVKGLTKLFQATSLAFLSLEGLYHAMGHQGRNNTHPQYTDHCFTGDYPTRIADDHARLEDTQLSLLEGSKSSSYRA